MKKFLSILWIFILLGGFAFAKGEPAPVAVEEGEDFVRFFEVVLFHGFASYYQPVLDEMARLIPNLKLTVVKGDAGRALIAAGNPPNVYMATPGGVSKYFTEGYLLELDDSNIENLADYKPGTLDPYYRDGKLYGIPVCTAVDVLNINLTLAEQVGFTVPDRDFLTPEEVLAFFELIKTKGPEGSYGTALYAANGGSQTRNFGWLSGFGARLFEDGDYTQTTINSSEALAGLNFLQKLVQNEYIEPFPTALDDDETLKYWGAGRYGLHWSRAGGMLGMIDNAVAAGIIDEPFKQRFMSFPVDVGAGQKVAPLTYGGMAGIVIKSGDAELDKMAARVLDYMTNDIVQTMTIRGGGNYATRFSAIPPAGSCIGDPGCTENIRVEAIWMANGELDLGYATLVVDGIFDAWLMLWQEFTEGNLEPRDFLDQWEEAINDLL